jgi:YnbE-like lipoprotein
MLRVKLTRTLRNAKAVSSCIATGSGKVKAIAALSGLAAMLSGCINIQAPEKPIVIQLDINIRADVVLALAEDAANTIEDNPDIF